METLKVSVIQTELHWEKKDKNRAMFESYFNDLNSTDLIILPEMFTTGFSMNPKAFAESADGTTVAWLQEWSAKLNAAIVGSIIIEEDQRFYNRLFFVHPEGKVQSYSKRHLFTLAGEEKVYHSGNQKLIVDYRGWKICPLICYDLRFPVWSRNIEGYDLLLYVANWPERRRYPWQTLLKARAIENLSYTIGVNRVGNDGNNISHSGDTSVIDPLGQVLYEAEPFKFSVKMVELSLLKLKEIRKRFQFLNDKDQFEIQN